MLNLLKRKPETEKPPFIEYAGEMLGRLFRKLGELLVKLIKRIIKVVW
jgi:hypothetical protein